MRRGRPRLRQLPRPRKRRGAGGERPPPAPPSAPVAVVGPPGRAPRSEPSRPRGILLEALNLDRAVGGAAEEGAIAQGRLADVMRSPVLALGSLNTADKLSLR